VRGVVGGPGVDAGAVRARVAALAERGIVAETHPTGQPPYAARAATRRGGRLPAEIWQALAAPEATQRHSPTPERSLGRTPRAREILLGRRARFAIATAPVAVAFVAAEWMVLTHSGSFARVLHF